VEYLKAWMMSPEHIAHPHPTEQEKFKIMADTGIELKQLTNWFVNNRKRYWKPRVEARLQEQTSSDRSPSTAAAVKDVDVVRRSRMNSLSLSNAISAQPGTFLVTSPAPAKTVSEPSMSASSSSTSLSLLSGGGVVISDHSENESVVSNDEVVVHNLSPSPSTSVEGTTEQLHQVQDDVLTQTEYVNVAILRPVDDTSKVGYSEEVPTIDDVTILNNVPSDRVLHVFEDCTLTYSVPCDSVSNIQQVRSLNVQTHEIIAFSCMHNRAQHISNV